MVNLRRHFSDSSGRLLGWLFPFTYLAHIAEECFADFPAHLFQTQGVVLSGVRFAVLQSLGLALMSLGIVISRRLGFSNRMLLILASIVLGNSLVHLFRSFWFGATEPGLISALVLWVPLASFTLKHAWAHVSRGRYLLNVIIGIAICVAVEITTIGG